MNRYGIERLRKTRYVLLQAAYTVDTNESGNVYFLGPASGATGFAVTLPLPSMGLNFRFIVKVAPTGTGYTIVPAASATILFGPSNSAQGGAVAVGTGELTLTFVASQAAVGDWADLCSDGTNWYVQAGSSLDAGITIA